MSREEQGSLRTSGPTRLQWSPPLPCSLWFAGRQGRGGKLRVRIGSRKHTQTSKEAGLRHRGPAMPRTGSHSSLRLFHCIHHFSGLEPGVLEKAQTVSILSQRRRFQEKKQVFLSRSRSLVQRIPQIFRYLRGRGRGSGPSEPRSRQVPMPRGGSPASPLDYFTGTIFAPGGTRPPATTL